MEAQTIKWETDLSKMPLMDKEGRPDSEVNIMLLILDYFPTNLFGQICTLVKMAEPYYMNYTTIAVSIDDKSILFGDDPQSDEYCIQIERLEKNNYKQIDNPRYRILAFAVIKQPEFIII